MKYKIWCKQRHIYFADGAEFEEQGEHISNFSGADITRVKNWIDEVEKEYEGVDMGSPTDNLLKAIDLNTTDEGLINKQYIADELEELRKAKEQKEIREQIERDSREGGRI